MKFLIKIVVLFFLVFLAAPTIVSLLQDDDGTKTSVAYGLDEEELQKEIKEVKISVVYSYGPAFVPFVTRTVTINSHNLQRHENVFGDIFIPPPERC